jgi:PilZ domain-containing protein
MSWRQALWEKVALVDDDVTVIDRPDEKHYGAFDDPNPTQENRRAEPRYTADEVPAITSVQLSGEQVRLLNISSSGILVESDGRIKPGERVKLSIVGLTPSVVPGVVVRCVVSAISSGGKLRYESGIAFGHRVSLPLGPAALRTAPDAAPAPPESPAVTVEAVPASPALPAAPPAPAALPAAPADARRALPRVRNRW